VERSDLRIDSWYLKDRSIRLRLAHIPTGVSVEETGPDPKTPLIQRLDRLVQELAAKVDAIDSGGPAG
jgi:hypothetical protein